MWRDSFLAFSSLHGISPPVCRRKRRLRRSRPKKSWLRRHRLEVCHSTVQCYIKSRPALLKVMGQVPSQPFVSHLSPIPPFHHSCDSPRGPYSGGHAGLDQVSRLSFLAQRCKYGRGRHWLLFALDTFFSFSRLITRSAPHVPSRCLAIHATLRLSSTAFRISRKMSWTRQISGLEKQSRTTTFLTTPLQGAMPPR